MNAALAGAQRLKSLRCFLGPGLAIEVKHPIQRANDHANADGICVLAARAPTIKSREQNLFCACDCALVVSAQGFVRDRTSPLACPHRDIEKIPKPAASEALA
jgi:hypothetical protein